MSATKRPWTLRRRIMWGVVGYLSIVLVAVGALSLITVTTTTAEVSDNQLTASLQGFEHTAAKITDSSGDLKKPLVDFGGQAPGSIIALVRDGEVLDSASFSSGDPVRLSAPVLAQFEAASPDGGIRTVSLEGMGDYRVDSVTTRSGDVLFAGVSLAVQQKAVMQQALSLFVIALLAVVIAAVGTVLIVRRSLRPLDRIVDSAAEVTRIPLDRGEVAIRKSVVIADTDARTEIGQVGGALDKLLHHVDDALAVRAQTDSRMRRFITDASHELRTPLAAILGYAELTRQESEQLPEMTEYALARIESESRRMSALVADLLLLARLDEGQDLHLSELDLREVVLDVVADARVAHQDHTWTTEVGTEPVTIVGDPERVHQLIANLLSNAAIHTPSGSSVTTGLSRIDGSAEISVRDDGPGIDPEVLPDLFQRFSRADLARTRDAGSTGLGLAIVASIVEAHEGTIEVASSGDGTVFTVRLPLPLELPRTEQSTDSSGSQDSTPPVSIGR
ncbi:sensor histidine kinase [Amnibacterium flavum]|uniref:histidine kinase n=1 Tax=Amnibacterium flavum TaxID=2173173 RepID=A0A2V1HNK9_9MICO|nr:ATP-binding protein [Amnibacterium flavum]PVZ94176.1 two-component sensor histidine kinase [Amnibacterium flavum]